jgi:hypothetical protein
MNNIIYRLEKILEKEKNLIQMSHMYLLYIEKEMIIYVIR